MVIIVKQSIRMAKRWRNVNSTVLRFPVSVLFLLAAAIVNAWSIIKSYYEEYPNISISLAIGALLYIVCQLIYEHFLSNKIYRYIFMALTILLTFFYYLIVRNNVWDIIMTVRTVVISFILTVLLIWIHSIKSKINFNQSFLAVFKSGFMAISLNCILFVGVAVILAAADLLLFDVNEKAYLHAANIIFIFIAPVTFLLYLPVFPAAGSMTAETQTAVKNDEENSDSSYYNGENLYRLISCGKFLETLISYIIIPVAAVFTLILAIYILINITGRFWTDNLLESMLVAYSITVIFIYLLASTIDNAWARLFRKVFPKVLVIVVLFQTISSLMRISNLGITHGRYYVILYGIFSTIAGLIFCVMPEEKNGIIAPILIILSVISILPGVDAFSTSRSNQIKRLKTVLESNNMLTDNGIIAKSNISKEDKEVVISSVSYLSRMDYTKNISWLSDYAKNNNFEKTFGFSMYADTDKTYEYRNVNRDRNEGIPIRGYDFMTVIDIYGSISDEPLANFISDDKNYTLHVKKGMNDEQLIALEYEKNVIASLSISDIFAGFIGETDYEPKKVEKMTFASENEKASLKVIVDFLTFNSADPYNDYSGQVYVMIKIK